MGQAPVLNYIDHLIDLVKEEKVVLDDIITHTLPLSEVDQGYEIFDEQRRRLRESGA
jgi:S-(hydroxymethyl)glutathione dehydrogenase/alcohol dehydrogenase